MGASLCGKSPRFSSRTGSSGFNSASWSRISKRGSGGAVLRRFAGGRARAVLTLKPKHYFYELIVLALAPGFMPCVQTTELLDEFQAFSTRR